MSSKTPTTLQVSSTRICVFHLVCSLIALVGCQAGQEEPDGIDPSELGLPVIRGSQLQEYVQVSEKPVLVEFGVDFNCPRCAQTKNSVVQLKENWEDQLDVIRVDFHANAQTVARLGGTVCPTYVLFDQGQPVLTKSFPVSIDLLEGQILQQLESNAVWKE